MLVQVASTPRTSFRSPPTRVLTDADNHGAQRLHASVVAPRRGPAAGPSGDADLMVWPLRTAGQGCRNTASRVRVSACDRRPLDVGVAPVDAKDLAGANRSVSHRDVASRQDRCEDPGSRGDRHRAPMTRGDLDEIAFALGLSKACPTRRRKCRARFGSQRWSSLSCTSRRLSSRSLRIGRVGVTVGATPANPWETPSSRASPSTVATRPRSARSSSTGPRHRRRRDRRERRRCAPRCCRHSPVRRGVPARAWSRRSGSHRRESPGARAVTGNTRPSR